MLDLLLANREQFMGNVELQSSLGYNDHEMVEFEVFRTMEMGGLDMLDKEKVEVLSDSYASVFKCPSHGKGKCRDWENEDLSPLQERIRFKIQEHESVHKSTGPD
ncbi:hypothetical protein DUI87_07059 [Hirundo rustica rustica]|uniref:Uncharacterized protein n=1 Tax=Hirundo rustica rustica TaxID=333673 RepID=A0A3M0KNS5_HIRRU|nr:hypothetical protein DUI87_07059 [Hirundo rustica rustica]